MIKRKNIHIVRIPEGEEKEKGIEALLKKKKTKNVPRLERDVTIQT